MVSRLEDSGQEGSQCIPGRGVAERGVAEGKRIIVAVKTPGSQVDSPASAEEGGEVRRRGRGRVDREGKCNRSRHWSRRPRARARSRAGVDIAPRISPRVSRPGHRRSILHSASHGWGEIYAVMTDDDDNADDVDFPDTLVSTRVSWKSPSSALSSSSVIAAFART